MAGLDLWLPQASTPDRLLERDGELAALRDALSRPAGSVVVIDGAGRGRQDRAAGRGARRSPRTQGCSCSRPGAPSSSARSRFGVVRQLFEACCEPSPDAVHRRGALRRAAARRRARGRAGRAARRSVRRPPRALLADREPRGRAAAGAVRRRRALGRRARRSASLAHIANRLAGIPVALVVASRSRRAGARRAAPRQPARCCTWRRSASDAAAVRGALVRAGRRRRAVPRLPRARPAATRSCCTSWRARCSTARVARRARRRAEPGAGDARDRGAAGAAARAARGRSRRRRPCSATASPLRQAAALAGIDPRRRRRGRRAGRAAACCAARTRSSSCTR